MPLQPGEPASGGVDLTNHFLVAMPAMADPNFEGAVVFVAEHGERGALGLVINRPIDDIDLRTLFDRVDLALGEGRFSGEPVYFGGPVQTDRGFVLHQPRGAWSSSVPVDGDLALTSSKDVLAAVAEGFGPERLLVTLGYSGWGPGQLEEELAQNAWLTVPADPALLFDCPVEDRYRRALGLLGIHPAFLSPDAGHA